MDARRFPTEPWMASRKIPTTSQLAGLPRRGRPFSLVRFFWASKRNELAEGETLLIE
jgi:hypothetical protein